MNIMSVVLTFGKFGGIDTFVEILIVIVAITLSIYSRKIYKFVQERNFNYFSLAFLFIAISFVFKIFCNMTISYNVTIMSRDFFLDLMNHLKYLQIFHFVNFTLFKIFEMIGFLILFLIISRTAEKEKIFLFLYLAVISVILSIYFNFVFNLTLVVILLFLTIHFYENFKNIKSRNSKFVFIAFLIVLVANVMFIFTELHSLFYLFGEILLLIGFIVLLFNQFVLKESGELKNEYKKNKTRSNQGHVRSVKEQRKG